jgi:predicted transcriptional regulator
VRFMVVGMIVGVLIFIAGVLSGAKFDIILSRFRLAKDQVVEKVRRKNPFEGKNGLLSYRNIRMQYSNYDEDDDE